MGATCLHSFLGETKTELNKKAAQAKGQLFYWFYEFSIYLS